MKIFITKMQEFRVNEYITLRLEEDKTTLKLGGKETVIYVSGEKFQQCKYLLINIPVDEVSPFDEIQSIDEAAERLDRTMEQKVYNVNLPPEAEFWGHCSNLQVWAENNYDTRLIHRDLAFPLLKKLVEVGDLKAKQVFKEEICKRLESGSKAIIDFLNEEGYLAYLDHEEILFALLKAEEAEVILEIEKHIGMEFSSYIGRYGTVYISRFGTFTEPKGPDIILENKHVFQLTLGRLEKKHSLDTLYLIEITKLNHLEYIYLEYYDRRLFEVMESLPALRSIRIGRDDAYIRDTDKRFKKKGK